MPITSLKIKERPQLLARGNYGERKGERIPPGGNHHPKMTAAKDERRPEKDGLKGQGRSAVGGPQGLRPTAPPRVDGGSASGQMPLREKVAWRSLAGLPAQEIGAKHRLS